MTDTAPPKDTPRTTDSTTIVELQREYGAKIAAVEPGGADHIPLEDRHGRPIQLFWTWTSPNLEFATVFLGVICVLFFGLSFGQTVLAIVVGTALGSLTHGLLSSWGPKTGFCQMVLSRSGFGFLGNVLPAGLNSLTAGIGWFAVNSVSGALALASLTTLPGIVCLVIVVAAMLALAFFGHNLIQFFEKYAFPLLAVIFVIGAVVVLTKTQPGAPTAPIPGAFWLGVATTFGYAAGWNPYASDYTRYLKPDVSGKAVGLFAGVGVFVSCVLLEVTGAAAVTAVGADAWNFDNPVESFTSLVPTWLGKLLLLAICIGAIAANAINIYSSGLSATAMGIKLPTPKARASVSLGMGLIGFVIAAIGLNNIGSYENFLLVIAYWIGPWLGVVFADRLLRRGTSYSSIYEDRGYTNWAGPIAMLVGAAVSIWLFSNQTVYVGLIAKAAPGIGDITFEIGFVLAFVIYVVLFRPMARPVPASVASTASAQIDA